MKLAAKLFFLGWVVTALASATPGVTASLAGAHPGQLTCRNLTTGQTVSGIPTERATKCADFGMVVSAGDEIRVEMRGRVPTGGEFVPPLFIYHPISEDGHFGFSVGDLDADNDLDIVQANPYRLWQNSGTLDPTFTSRDLNGIPAQGEPHLVDLDENGTLDLVIKGPAVSEELRWYPNLGGSPPAFDNVLVDTQPGWEYWEPVSVDVNGDGDLDLMARVDPSFGSDKLVWFEQVDELSFVAHIVFETPDLREATALDFDEDGDGDFLVVTASEVLLFLNTGGAPPVFTSHVLDQNQPAVTLEPLDMDLDGDLDVALAPVTGDLVVYENLGPASPFFTPHVVGTIEVGGWISTGDIDNDGLPDIVAAGQSTARGETKWLRNLGTTPPSFMEHTVSIERRAIDVQSGDLDGDSDLDLVADDLHDADIFWFEQRQVFGGWMRGLLDPVVSCLNVTTGASRVRQLRKRFAWDCEAMGVAVGPGDQVVTVIGGSAANWE